LDSASLPNKIILSLAGLSVAIARELYSPFPVWPDYYRSFFSTDSGRPVDSHFRMGRERCRPALSGFVPAFKKELFQFGTVAGRSIFRFQIHESPPYLEAEPDEEFRSVDVWLGKDINKRVPPLLQSVDRILCAGLLAMRSGFIVHSCGWACNGKSIVFPGISGAGKTTLCRQLMASGHGAVLSDDRVILREGSEGFHAWGTPWPGDAKQARNESAPLAALCFIEKSPEHYLQPIQPAEALRRLLQTAAVPWFSPGLRDRVLPVLDRLVSTLPAFRLGFRPEPGVINCLLPLVKAVQPQHG
jgi:hypothetical protein